MRLHAHFVAGLLTCVACTENAAPEGSAPAGSAQPAPGAMSTASSAATNSELQAPPDRSLITTKPDGAPKRLEVVAYRAQSQDFLPGAQASRAFRIFPFQSSMVVAQAGNVYAYDGQSLKLDPKAVTTEPVAGNTPLLGAYEVIRLQGSWPDALFAYAEFNTFLGARQATNRNVAYRRANGTWEVQTTLPRSASAWTPGVVLALNGGKLDVAIGTAKGPKPKQATGGSGGQCSEGQPLVRGLDVAALATGEVFVLGERCDTGLSAVEWWKAGSETGTIDDLPDAPKAPGAPGLRHMRVGSPTSAMVAITVEGSKPYVARFDGRGFRQIETHDRGNVSDAAQTSDGASFLVMTDSSVKPRTSTLLRLLADGSYSRWKAPRNRTFETLWAKDATTAFTAWNDTSGEASVLFGTQPKALLGSAPEAFTAELPAKPEAAPAPTASAEAPIDGAAAFPKHTDACAKPFVFLYDISANTPATFDFPKTRKALAASANSSEIELLDFKFGGKRRLGVRVPTKEIGAALVKQTKESMPEDNPELVCFDPAADARTIKL